MSNTEKWVIQNTHGQLLQSFAIDPESDPRELVPF